MNATTVVVAGAIAAAAQVFAPGVISSNYSDFAPAFSQDMSWLMFTRGDDGASALYISRRDGASWSVPVLAPFSGHWIDLESALAPDGSYVVFASDRPLTAGGAALQAQYFGKPQTGGNLWRSDRTGDRWGVPYRLPGVINGSASVWTPSIAANGALYFMATDPQTGRFRIHVAVHPEDKSAGVRNLAFSDGSADDVDPYIAPDRTFLIFGSDRDAKGAGQTPGVERLYIAFHPEAATPRVCALNVPGFEDRQLSELEPRLSPDQKTLYFSSRRLAHLQQQSSEPPWDNGKLNIWSVAFQPSLWQEGSTKDCQEQAL
ncbi:MAG TPA: hypothetical protein VH000_03710 [Rhizomicrobium sp.]|jgi:hypothetical protein|nr:hypothetical protein [Rhizomicrobium sp.]